MVLTDIITMRENLGNFLSLPKEKIELIKKVRKKPDLPIAIMLDTKDPEYRIKTFENNRITLSDCDKFIFTTDDVEGNQDRASVNYKNLTDDLNIGDTIMVNNGLVQFDVNSMTGGQTNGKSGNTNTIKVEIVN